VGYYDFLGECRADQVMGGGAYLIPSSVLWLLVIACFAGCADKAGTVKGKRSWRSGSGVQS
jgi:hypothetical protein